MWVGGGLNRGGGNLTLSLTLAPILSQGCVGGGASTAAVAIQGPDPNPRVSGWVVSGWVVAVVGLNRGGGVDSGAAPVEAADRGIDLLNVRQRAFNVGLRGRRFDGANTVGRGWIRAFDLIPGSKVPLLKGSLERLLWGVGGLEHSRIAGKKH